jgi:hypothetical protein
MKLATLVIAAVLLAGCDREPPPKSTAGSAKPPASASAGAGADDMSALRFPAPGRLVAIGDLHGDLEAARSALRLAGAIDDKDRWIGKDLVVVQTGDLIDRGDHDRAVLDLIDRLVGEAKAAGGALHVLNGNHELMNAAGDFRYVTSAAFKEFIGVGGLTLEPRLQQFPEPYRPRAAAFLPGGPYARILGRRSIAAIVGDTVFVHGGVTPAYVRYGLGRLDREVRSWLDGNGRAPQAIVSDDGPVWTRRYSDRPSAQDCDALGEALHGLGVKRMVVGHTVQKEGINAACDQRVWRIDVGMAGFYGGQPEVLEITGERLRPIRGKRGAAP